MYLLFELILFSPLIVYACLQVRKLIPGAGLKRLFVFLFLLTFLGYPIAELLSHQRIGGWVHYVMIPGYYCLPYLLYVTLSVAVIDLGIILAHKVRLFRPEAVSRPLFRSIRLASYLGIPALIVTWGAWNNNRLEIKNLSVELPQKSSSVKNLHVVFASDFHLSQITNEHVVEDFVSKVNSLNPNIVLIGGDVLEGDREEDLEKYETEFRKIRSTYGVYAASGNHERHRGGASGFYARSGMELIEDGVEKIGGTFYLGVRKNARFSQRMSIFELLNKAPENLPIILLDHSPTDLENVSRSRVDLQFSGHTHNGQLFPVNLFVMPFQYELPWGTMLKQHTMFIVTSGVQAWGPPVKTAGRSEILSVRIRFISSPKAEPISRLWARFVQTG
jgi:hypothetical protein